jgi:hypothetical protein
MFISALILLVTFIVSMIMLTIAENKEKKQDHIVINNIITKDESNQGTTKEDLENMKKDIIKSMAREFKVNRYLNK